MSESLATFLDTTKSTLGKLLASENISVEHQQVSGPYFDVKERKLVLPIWKDMTADLYDLFIGHEVGHALFTPANGWNDALEEYGMEFKTPLNVIEDVRIEKKMKRKYPGLRKPMFDAYGVLVERNFFGVQWNDMNSLPVMDRLNLHFKLGERTNISFSNSEQDFITRVENAETWSEVINLSKELFKMADMEKENMENFSNDSGERDGEGEAMELEQLDNTKSQESKNDNNNSKQYIPEESTSEESTEQKQKQTANTRKPSGPTQHQLEEWKESDVLYSITQEAFEQQAQTLIDEEAYPPTYVKWPKLDVKNWVIPAHVVYDEIDFERTVSEEEVTDMYNKFMTYNNRYVLQMVKEFELRRNAKQFARARVSTTGELDIKKVWKYKFAEDLFLQKTIVPNAKNHGMLMVLDMSSSMSQMMGDTIHQMITLVMFCRKANIPFEVYGFSDVNNKSEMVKAGIPDIINNRNECAPNTIFINEMSFRLKQFFHHKMSLTDFNNAIRKLLTCAKYYDNQTYRIPHSMRLGGTPLMNTLLVLRQIAENFKNNTNVEILNTIFLTDGEGYDNIQIYGDSMPDSNGISQYKGIHPIPWGGIVTVEDQLTKKRVVKKPHSDFFSSMLELYRNATGSKVIGFYLMERMNKMKLASKFYGTKQTGDFEKQYNQQFVAHKYFSIKNTGYDVFYMLPANELEIENTNMDDYVTDGNQTKRTLLTAFKKMQKKKNVSRVFINQFIQEIS